MHTPSRSLSLDGTSNFRDLGGYTGHGGRTLRWRRIFRSDHLGSLTPQDVDVLAGVGLARVVDFRGAEERAAHQCAMPGVKVLSLPIEPSIVQDMQLLLASGCRVTAHDTVGLMEKTYRQFVEGSSGRFAELFSHLLESDDPLVFHCTAGKDRTGFAAALILHALGVERPVVVQDYLLTNELFRMPTSVTRAAPQEVLEIMWSVQETFLNAAFKAVDAQYGGLQAYLHDAMRIGPAEQARLHDLYLLP